MFSLFLTEKKIEMLLKQDKIIIKQWNKISIDLSR